MTLLDFDRQIMIVGDFNFCAVTERNHAIFKTLSLLGFHQIVSQSTHIEGRVIDHVYYYAPDVNMLSPITVHHKSPYFTDHDLLLIRQARNCYYFISITYYSFLSLLG